MIYKPFNENLKNFFDKNKSPKQTDEEKEYIKQMKKVSELYKNSIKRLQEDTYIFAAVRFI